VILRRTLFHYFVTVGALDMIRLFYCIFVGAAALVCLQTGDMAQAQALGQPKVAVYNFRDPSRSGVAPQLNEMIITAIINTRKFNVFSRDFSSSEEEKQLERAKKVGKKASTVAESVDYSIEGAITGSQSGTQSDNTGTAMGDTIAKTTGLPIHVFFKSCSKQTISISVDVAIKQISTQKTPYAQSLTRAVESKCKSGGSAVDLPALMREIANELAFEFATEIYPIKVIGKQPNGTALVNYGASFLPPGTYLKFTGPPTKIESDGLMVDSVGTSLGRGRVIEANAATALIAMEAGAALAPNRKQGHKEKEGPLIMVRSLVCCGLAVTTAISSVPAHAGSLSVGNFTSEESCRVFVTEWEREIAVAAGSSSSSSAVAANPLGAAGARRSSSQASSAYLREWGTELNQICSQNFPRIRSTMASALASSGSFNPGDGAFTVNGFLTDIGYETTSYGSASVAEANGYILASITYQVKNARGNVVYGGSFTKRFNTDTAVETSSSSFQSSQSGRTVFSQLQEQIGFAVARQVLFHFEPLRVTANDGRSIALNYGPPIIPMGAAVLLSGERSLEPRRLTVISATPRRAIAQSPTFANLSDVPIGSAVFFAEPEDGYSETPVIPGVALP
jgi:hypothetical protein